MGQNFIDRFSLLHFASGIVAYFLGIPLVFWIIIHFIFEILENEPEGIYFIDTYIKLWPGGKKSSDSVINSLGDEIFSIIGWLSAYWISGFKILQS
jgi:hypothetical protein